MKSIFNSKTMWVAVLQGSIAVVLVYSAAYPEVGWLLLGKSLLDIVLRFVTVQPVTV